MRWRCLASGPPADGAFLPSSFAFALLCLCTPPPPCCPVLPGQRPSLAHTPGCTLPSVFVRLRASFLHALEADLWDGHQQFHREGNS